MCLQRLAIIDVPSGQNAIAERNNQPLDGICLYLFVFRRADALRENPEKHRVP
jgi:hypothetical protein